MNRTQKLLFSWVLYLYGRKRESNKLTDEITSMKT